MERDIIGEVCRVVSESVDFEILKRIQSAPEKDDSTELDRLRIRKAELEGKIKRGSANLLIASPDLFAPLQAALLELQNELQRVNNTLTLAMEDDGSAIQTDFMRWWKKVRGTLIAVGDFKFENQRARLVPITLSDRQKTWYAKAVAQSGKRSAEIDVESHHPDSGAVLTMNRRRLYRNDSGEFFEWEGVEDVLPPILAEPEPLGALLHKLNCTITLRWVPNGKRYFTLESGVMKLGIEEYHLCPYMNTPANPATPSSTSSSAR